MTDEDDHIKAYTEREMEREDREAIYKLFYGAGPSAYVHFAHVETNVVHGIMANSNAIGVSLCGLRITRKNSSDWRTANFETVTCMTCIAEET